MKRLVLILFVGLLTLAAEGQMVNPVHFSSQLKTLKGGEAEIIFSATIDDGWHVYSTDMGSDGPISATFNVVKMEGVETVGKLQPRGQVTKQYDKMFGMELRFFEKKGQFVQRVRFTQSKYVIDCYLEYGACNDEMCLPPTEVAFKTEGVCKELKEDKKEIKEEKVVPVAPEPEKPADTVAVIEIPAGTDSTVTAEVQEPVAMPMVEEKVTDHSLLYILLMGFVGGLLAVLMPCIWPIIPMTVSFFLKRAKTDRKKGLRDALTYGLSIVVIYLALGLMVTLLFGSDTLNAMSTNAVFNVFLFILLVVFALSFFGWFEIKLPSRWADAVDDKATTTSGYISIHIDQRLYQHLPDGFHAGVGVVLLYSTHHRTAVGGDSHHRQLAGTCLGHAGLCRRIGTALYALCPVPLMAATGSEVGLMDEHAEGGAGIHRVGLRPEIPECGRFGLRLAYT